MNAPQLRKAVLPFIAGFVLCGALVLLLTRGAGSKLNADLLAAGWNLESARRTNIQLATNIRELRRELDSASGLAEINQSIITAQQQQLGDQQRLVDGIAETIKIQGGDIRGKIKAITDGFRRLYKFYYPSED
jgi:predicted ABC-type sugar transport system permease subunit